MKIALLTALAAVAASPSFAADVNVIGARSTVDLPAAIAPMTSDASVNVVGAQSLQMKQAADTKIAARIASKSVLDRATALLNKIKLATDNNIFISRSNLVFTQNDRLAMREKVQDALKQAQEQKQAVTTATLTKNVLRAVSAPDTDTALMTKASAVVAARGDASALTQRIADFVDAAGKSEMEQEQAIQSQTPRGIIVMVGTKDVLRQPTAVVNKNIAKTDNQIAISRSNLAPTQNDQVALTGNAKVADAVLPAAMVDIGKVAKSGEDEEYRVKIAYPLEGDADDRMKSQEFGGFGGLGWGGGWRYPLEYWNTYGGGFYGGGCGLGYGYGGFYYC